MHSRPRTAETATTPAQPMTLVAAGTSCLLAIVALAPPPLLSGALDLARLVLEL